MNFPLLSVIIPIFNTSQYLKKSIDSVINQTYNNLEIILVDDGSTDDSGHICDEYKQKDNRIKVIHKKNGGLSDARNAGVSICKGDYLIFLDSDDYWLKNDFIDKAMPTDEDICFFGYSNSINGSIIEDNFIYRLKNSYESGNSFLLDALNIDHVFYWYAWRYIIKTSLWKDNKISFPIGINYEDTATMYKPLLFAKKIKIYKDNCYCYETRDNSITRFPKLKNYLDHIEVINSGIDFVKGNKNIDDNTKEKLFDNFASSYFGVLIELTLLNKCEQQVLINKMEENIHLVDYILYGKQKIAKYLIKFFGIKNTSRFLTVRRMLKYKR